MGLYLRHLHLVHAPDTPFVTKLGQTRIRLLLADVLDQRALSLWCRDELEVWMLYTIILANILESPI